ncbi:hypothetical protein KP509_37G036800 [Ceratopteris richardii]|uniref:MLO-like protein n=1 Tax=Ceratopteris richardii TaxID=49495 RepID=A0A8T2Q7Y5_CERRI|nr:hypothetical protein KP509_37G036800 [Ceratopteris richardii]
MAEEVDESVSLLTAPTWGIALTCALFVVISLAVDQVILRVGKGLAGKHKYEALFLAFEKIKNELLMVGILSLALAMGQNSFSKVCVSESWYKLKPLCKHPLSDTDVIIQEKHSTCPEGRIPFMTAESIHDLHILIFILAIVHILYSIMIIVIGMCEVHRWQAWEVSAAEKLKSEMFVDIEGNVRVTRETTFIRRRASASVWLENALIAYMVAFLKQFYTWRIKETDYVSLRNGFIKHHFPMNLDFNFHKFILRTFQDDCKRVVGIGWKLWIYAVFYLLIDVDGWETNWFATFAPLVVSIFL